MSPDKKLSVPDYNLYGWYLLLLGIISGIFQLILVREYMMLFAGNELLTGIIFTCWMWTLATGAMLGTKIKIAGKYVGSLIVLLSLTAVFTIATLRLLKPVFFIYGVEPPLFKSVLFILFSMLPFTLLSGMLFTFTGNKLYSLGANRHDAYTLDSAGMMTGTIVFTLLLSGTFFSFQILILVLSGVFAFLALFAWIKQHRLKLYVWLFLASVFAAFAFNAAKNDIEIFLTSPLFPHHQIKHIHASKTGQLVSTDYEGQEHLFENGTLITCNQNIEEPQELVHISLSQLNPPYHILCISGDFNGIKNQTAKYKNATTVFIHLNPEMSHITGFVHNPDSLFKIYFTDPFLFLDTTTKKFNAVLLPLPLPSNLYLNRFYTADFYRLIKDKMTKNGVVILKVNLSSHYLADKERKLASTVYSTLKKVFNNVVPVSASTLYLISGDSTITLNFGEITTGRNIAASYVNTSYFNEDDMIQKSAKILKQLTLSETTNTIFNPVCVYQNLGRYFEYLKTNLSYLYAIVLLLAVIIIAILKKLKTTETAIALTGFTSSSLQMVVIILFQSFYGNLYSALSFIVCLFMAGLAGGSFSGGRWIAASAKNYFNVHLCFSLLTLLVIIYIQIRNQLSPGIQLKLFLYLVSFISGFLTGLQFAWSLCSSAIVSRKSLAVNFSGDLLGAGIGSVLIPVILLPVFGFSVSLFFMALLNLMFYLLSFNLWKKKT